MWFAVASNAIFSIQLQCVLSFVSLSSWKPLASHGPNNNWLGLCQRYYIGSAKKNFKIWLGTEAQTPNFVWAQIRDRPISELVHCWFGMQTPTCKWTLIERGFVGLSDLPDSYWHTRCLHNCTIRVTSVGFCYSMVGWLIYDTLGYGLQVHWYLVKITL